MTAGPDRARSAARGALLGLAIGDAVGAPYEGTPIVHRDDVELTMHGMGSMRWTDDTAMALGLAEVLGERRGRPGNGAGPLDVDALARRFAADLVAEPWRGYGGGARAILGRIHDGGDFRELAPMMFDGRGSWGNGAAMRAAPCGIVHAGDPAAAAALAREQAAITHAHPLGADGAAIVAALVATAAARPDALDDRASVRAVVEQTVGTSPVRDQWQQLLADALSIGSGATAPDVLMVASNGVAAAESVPAAVAVALTHPGDHREAVALAVTLGGDTDTIAAMAGAVVGAAVGEGGLDPALVERVEQAQRLRDAADQLLG